MAERLPEGTYLTIGHDGEGRLTEKMSRFLAFAKKAESSIEAKAIVKEFANNYHDARHVCWAYMIGPGRNDFMSNDNGEPSGTAGRPILGQINSLGLTNVLVIVVRYFGGIKLGTPGLTAAYREAARLALENAGIREVTRCEEISFKIPYESVDKVMRFIKEKEIEIKDQKMEMVCAITAIVPLTIIDEFKERLKNINGLVCE